MADDRPLKRPYARIERERRFLLEGLPPAVDPEEYERLRDCYVEGTNLRLRRLETPGGEPILVKLGQKKPDPEAPGDPRHRQMTTLYLEPHEGEVLAGLTGARSVKRRYRLREQGWTFVIDVYEEPPSAEGIILAEVECDTDAELDAISLPAWAVREVTEDGAWSGHALASGQDPR